ncbi:MAG: InlB B-repeat-containing protein, partial [Spirochaetes bacterium]|nr:InlB B-repeat-containing protein [Spirochaetota bacterium]
MRITSNRYTGKHKPLFAVMLCAAALTLSIISCGDAYYDVLHGNMTNMVPSEIRSVTYSGNGSTSGTPPEDTTIYLQGQSVTVLGNTGSLARTGHTLGTPMWNTAPDGTGIDYAPGDSLTMGALGVILYARWDINQYTVSFNTYGGTPVPSPQTVNYGATATQPAPDPSLTGYTFAGWFTDGTYSTVWNFGSMTVSGDTTIHALWTKNQYTVSFDSQGGTPTPAFQPVDYGDCAMDPGTPTRAGYTFIGWFTASTGGSQWNFGSDVVTGNMMLYAHWDGIPYTVTYHPNGDETAGSPPVDGNTYYIGDTVTVLWCGTMR